MIAAALALVLGGCATGGAEFEQGQTLAGQQKYDEAIRAYEQAIAKTNIDGYRKDCEKRLAEAREKVGK